ncbi:hypothetical protein GC255_21615 [Escherichia coli]|nr:hypothetical protein [Escherichia coli]
MRQRDVFSDQASIASWALFSLHRKKLYEYRNANGVKISVKMSSPEHYANGVKISVKMRSPEHYSSPERYGNNALTMRILLTV